MQREIAIGFRTVGEEIENQRPRFCVGQQGGNGFDHNGIPAERFHFHARLLKNRKGLHQKVIIARREAHYLREEKALADRPLPLRLPPELLKEDPFMGGVLIDEDYPLFTGKNQIRPRRLTDIMKIGKTAPFIRQLRFATISEG